MRTHQARGVGGVAHEAEVAEVGAVNGQAVAVAQKIEPMYRVEVGVIRRQIPENFGVCPEWR